jgi:hypothetical protein
LPQRNACLGVSRSRNQLPSEQQRCPPAPLVRSKLRKKRFPLPLSGSAIARRSLEPRAREQKIRPTPAG